MSLTPKAEDPNALQVENVFELESYRSLKKFVSLLGLDPYDQSRGVKIRMKVVLYTMILIMYAVLAQLCVAIQNKDFDGVIEEIPHVLVGVLSLNKFLNLHLNRKRFKILLNYITRDWMTIKGELHVLKKVTQQGCFLSELYRTTLLIFSTLFVYIPLFPVTLDLIIPLNETRPRAQLFGVHYIIFDEKEHFFIVYLHLAWTSIITIMIVVTVDSMYILIIHHASGLLDVCGYLIEMASSKEKLGGDDFKQCVITHHKALQFFNTVQSCSGTLNLLSVLLTIMAISLTAIQIIMNADRPEEAMRFVLFLIGQKYHLFIISMIGQILLNHDEKLTVKLFASNWYRLPVKSQKVLHIMQIRCSKPCTLTAQGLYDMNIEYFGKAVKACMSYFTMFLSLRE